MSTITKATAAALGAGALVLTACGGSSDDAGGDGPIGISVHMIGYGTAPPDDDIIKTELDKALDIDIELTVAADEEEYYNQLATSLAGGDAPDLFVVNRAHLSQYVSQGLVLDLSDRLDDLADYKNLLGDDDKLRAGTIDDKLYALPKRLNYEYNSYWIRKDWLDNLGLEMPETVDDFFAVAQAFTEQDPDGNGQDDTYGLTGATNNALWNPLWAAFGAAPVGATGGGTFYVEDGQVVNSYDDPDLADALTYFNSLVAAGYVDPDYATNQNLQDHERAMQGVAGILTTDWPHMTKPEFVDQYKDVQPDAEWVQLGPLSGPAGPGAFPVEGYARTMYAVPSTLSDDDAKLSKIVELVNYLSGDEGNRLASYGIEGEHYTMSGDEVTLTERGKTEGEYFWLYLIPGRDDGEYLPVKFADQAAEIEFAANQAPLTMLGSLVTPPEGYNSADASTFASEQIARFISGELPMSEYSDFLATLKNDFGYQAYIDSGIEQLEALGVAE
ncbi:extracellular solute-binding protein [Jiangella aurantiaca]|nr:extracellular solute-binding protein [Jiangella aurantiaca]